MSRSAYLASSSAVALASAWAVTVVIISASSELSLPPTFNSAIDDCCGRGGKMMIGKSASQRGVRCSWGAAAMMRKQSSTAGDCRRHAQSRCSHVGTYVHIRSHVRHALACWSHVGARIRAWGTRVPHAYALMPHMQHVSQRVSWCVIVRRGADKCGES